MPRKRLCEEHAGKLRKTFTGIEEDALHEPTFHLEMEHTEEASGERRRSVYVGSLETVLGVVRRHALVKSKAPTFELRLTNGRDEE